jgi:hypothetical protein
MSKSYTEAFLERLKHKTEVTPQPGRVKGTRQYNPPATVAGMCLKCNRSHSWEGSERTWCWWCEGRPGATPIHAPVSAPVQGDRSTSR